jgi:hypothetical protein
MERMAKAAQTAINVADWRDACRRGAVLGLVLGLHGLLLMVLLHLDWLRRLSPHGTRGAGIALHLQFFRIHTRPAAAPPPIQLTTRARKAAGHLPAHSAAGTPVMAPTPSQPDTVVTAPAVAGSSYQPYHPGGFEQALQQAQRGSPVRLPGRDVTVAPGLRLEPKYSIKHHVERILKSVRCYDEQVSMQHHFGQFGTERQIDRRLEAEGCGPHLEHTPADDTLQQVIQRVSADGDDAR